MKIRRVACDQHQQPVGGSGGMLPQESFEIEGLPDSYCGDWKSKLIGFSNFGGGIRMCILNIISSCHVTTFADCASNSIQIIIVCSHSRCP